MVEVYPLTIRFLHMLSGILWIGGAVLWSAVIMPRVTAKVPPPARASFIVNLGPTVASYLTNAGYVVIVTGLWNMVILAGGVQPAISAFNASNWGRALGVGLVLSLVAIGIAHAAIKPALKEIIELLKKMPQGPPPAGAAPPTPPPRMAELGKKLMISSMVTMALAVIVIAAMAFAVASRAG